MLMASACNSVNFWLPSQDQQRQPSPSAPQVYIPTSINAPPARGGGGGGGGSGSYTPGYYWQSGSGDWQRNIIWPQVLFEHNPAELWRDVWNGKETGPNLQLRLVFNNVFPWYVATVLRYFLDISVSTFCHSSAGCKTELLYLYPCTDITHTLYTKKTC